MTPLNGTADDKQRSCAKQSDVTDIQNMEVDNHDDCETEDKGDRETRVYFDVFQAMPAVRAVWINL